jgi:hypothetical protein
LRHLVRDIGELYKVLFKRKRKPGSSIFTNDILTMCNISAEDTRIFSALSEVRMALREPHVRAPVSSAPPDKDLDELLNSMSMMSTQPINYEVARLPAPLPSECTLSEKNQLDFDNMSSERSSSSGEIGRAIKDITTLPAIDETSAEQEGNLTPMGFPACILKTINSELADYTQGYYDCSCKPCRKRLLMAVREENKAIVELGL